MHKIVKTHRSFFGETSLMEVEVGCQWCEYKKIYTVDNSQTGIERAKEQLKKDHTYRQHQVVGHG